ncbi:MAG: electron transfer flavoprotein subunit alpha/FixB family protein [Proteobacteria bacterium]|nr:electron transfer flavoprotein subunit alpha/FixB family protein [Pseudomonadota bacterium]MBU1581509.1 electron transfer flavoprotein subunit alpha/FixB family protein [Pseudomonadota bacterium]MBU2454705.1 electron transfer flavoprotein subunit alpha/FixB family protein [Pseudomonadota bacterium]MBU2628079.1 electron transfer flavoprotein subunit alpha/FixB family protein [Pseudomonadota bacterium]
MNKKIGIIIELEKGKIKESNFGMITLARAKDTELFAIVINADTGALKEDLSSFGITKIIDVSLSCDQQNNPAAMASAIIHIIRVYHFSIIFGLSTAKGKDLLPRIAALVEAPLVMDCFHVDLDKNLAKTSQYSGKTIATIKATGDILVFGIRPNAVESVKEPALADILVFDGSTIVSKGFRVLKTGDADEKSDISLAEAEVILAGGRGMKNGENFAILFDCAKKMNAVVGASRVAVDSGWVPYSMQVGQTGEKVSPKVYIACGISGSIQHFAGMKTSGMVIAINTEETASIMSNCDYFVVADVMDIIPEVTKLLKNG